MKLLMLFVLSIGMPAMADSLYTTCKSKAQLTTDSNNLDETWTNFMQGIVNQNTASMYIESSTDSDVKTYSLVIVYDAVYTTGQTQFQALAYKINNTYSFVGINNSMHAKITGTLSDCVEPGPLD